jgi:glycosyltransferase involved in cell wall biosynthesis
VFDAHNATWAVVERMRRNVRWPLKPVLAIETRRVKRYEGSIIHQFDHTLAVSEVDRLALLHAAHSLKTSSPVTPHCISVIPIAVDTAQLQPMRRSGGARNILTLGTLHYPPNADGIRWFIRKVFPLIQQAVEGVTLTVVGMNPPRDFFQLASRFSGAITLTGYVPDLTPYLEQAAVVVVPVLAGGGMRVRILEAFSRGMPIVTTTIGLEGIEARPGEDVLVADTPDDFADSVVGVLNDPHLQDRLATRGRRLAVTRYDWRVVLKQLDAVYEAARSQRIAQTSHRA